MLGINSRASRCDSWEMEYDCYQHYFLDDLDKEEDFYKSTAPSEDIWKKFALLPTPPMSPNRTISGGTLYFTPGDKFGWLSKVLGQDEEYEGPDTEELFGNMSSIIIQDCMWSSFSASQHLEKVSERLSAAAQARLSPPAPQNNVTMSASKAQCTLLTPPDSPLPSTVATECVDPAAVLTFPTISCRKPASSGSESRSDSSDDDEVIDVVTVESKQSRARLVGSRKPVTITVRADPCPKRFHMSVHRQQHNYAAPSPDSDPEDDEEPQSKRSCPDSSHHQQTDSPTAISSTASSADSPQSSDTEDTDRRKNHNFLERKRRNDLRSRFLALRDVIPGLVESAKAPKVAILTQATEYLLQLHSREKHQAQERKRLKARQQKLLRRLADLKRS
ncbi:myeloid cell leukemia sequence 1b [Salmo salar]|uniref:L-Myc-1b n=1 Tax=Salmo salar TaxID=8030 RepID=B5XBE9_SALSA|nr:myeloid cell leukemia sequence 1b [Salmo salar]ACI68169.1 L-Myc-1b [Salmo salar]|eukprot:NP_001134603.1 myeloid cell leukemia sequence 1b [Salmo salar]